VILCHYTFTRFRYGCTPVYARSALQLVTFGYAAPRSHAFAVYNLPYRYPVYLILPAVPCRLAGLRTASRYVATFCCFRCLPYLTTCPDSLPGCCDFTTAAARSIRSGSAILPATPALFCGCSTYAFTVYVTVVTCHSHTVGCGFWLRITPTRDYLRCWLYYHRTTTAATRVDYAIVTAVCYTVCGLRGAGCVYR